MIINCKTAARLISETMDRPLSFSERVSLRVHYYLCHYFGSNCAKYQKQVQYLRQMARSYAQKTVEGVLSEAMPPAIKNRLRRRLSRQNANRR